MTTHTEAVLAPLMPAAESTATPPGRTGGATEELRDLLIEQRRILLQQARAIELLDQRREELEELLEIALPIGNAALGRAIRQLDTLEKSGLPAAGRNALRTVRATLASPPPRWRQLWRRLRSPESRRGLSALLDLLAALGSLGASAPNAHSHHSHAGADA